MNMFWELLEAALKMYDCFWGIINFDPVKEIQCHIYILMRGVTWGKYIDMKMKSFAPP